MITLDLNHALEQEINAIANSTGKNAGQFLTEIITDYLEDKHDALMAEKAVHELETGQDTTISLAELERSINALDN